MSPAASRILAVPTARKVVKRLVTLWSCDEIYRAILVKPVKPIFRTLIMSTEIKKVKMDAAKIGTHSGNFHCDEVLACFMLQQLDKYKDAEIVRSRDLNVLNKCDIVVDVGDIFDAEKNRFDHHQKTFTETLSSLRPELGDKYSIRLSSAGLIYAYFGKDVIEATLRARQTYLSMESIDIIYRKVYENFIEEVDAKDNGIPICEGKQRYNITTDLSSRVAGFNPPWNHDGSDDETSQFEKAKAYVGAEFVDKVIYYATRWLPARDIVREALDNAEKVHKSLSIIELSKFCPWKEHLFDLENERSITGRTKYALFEDKPGDSRVICVPVAPNSFICRKFLPKEWRGMRGTELKKISGIDDATFCHMGGFIGGASSAEGVFAMAVKSLEDAEC